MTMSYSGIQDQRLLWGINMENRISKSKFKPNALKYFRTIEETGKEVIITDRGKPVLKIVRYVEEPSALLQSLRNSVIRYDDPCDPVGDSDWEALK